MSEPLPEPLAEVQREIPGIRLRRVDARRVRTEVEADALPTLLEWLKGRTGHIHLSALSCVEWPEADQFELVYQVWSYESRLMVAAHTRIPRNPGRYVSVYDLHTPAGFFERDIHEMFGIYFEGAPDMRPFILTEWQGPPPMLKSFSTKGYVAETYRTNDYNPEWLKELRAQGGDFINEPAPRKGG